MKYAKMLGLLAMAAAALMAFAGSASATELTSPVNVKLASGETIHATSEEAVKLDGSVTITCQHSTVQGKVTTAGGAATTVDGHIETLTFGECGTATVEVLTKGTLVVHTEYTKEGPPTEHWTQKTTNTGNGTLTSNGAEITVLTHNILGTIHCIYKTNNTAIGTLTGSKNTGGTATLDIGSSPIPEVATDTFACKDDAVWTGNYKVNIPDYLDVD